MLSMGEVQIHNLEDFIVSVKSINLSFVCNVNKISEQL